MAPTTTRKPRSVPKDRKIIVNERPTRELCDAAMALMDEAVSAETGWINYADGHAQDTCLIDPKEVGYELGYAVADYRDTFGTFSLRDQVYCAAQVSERVWDKAIKRDPCLGEKVTWDFEYCAKVVEYCFVSKLSDTELADALTVWLKTHPAR